MGATSVTGVGPGDSKGEWKRENNSGCCGKTDREEIEQVTIRRGCFTRYKCCGTNKYSCCSTVKAKGC